MIKSKLQTIRQAKTPEVGASVLITTGVSTKVGDSVFITTGSSVKVGPSVMTGLGRKSIT